MFIFIWVYIYMGYMGLYLYEFYIIPFFWKSLTKSWLWYSIEIPTF